ncbi:MAG: hypothetical protein IJJ33_12565 [Victivallales bacterium]|nr:hypothetical protein [Victivallales bacterium]
MAFRFLGLGLLLLAFSDAAALSPDYFRGIQATLAQEEAVAETLPSVTPAPVKKEFPMPEWKPPPSPWLLPLVCWCAALACLSLAARPLGRRWRCVRERKRLERLLRDGSREDIRAAFAATAHLPPGSDFLELAEAFPNSPWQAQLRQRDKGDGGNPP